MANRQRLVLLGLAAAVAVVAVIALGAGGGDDEAGVIDTRTTPTASQTTTAASATATADDVPQAATRRQIPVVRVQAGRPAGGVETLRFRKGGDIVFDVRSDAAGHVHLHGYDVLKDLVPGERVRFEVEATVDGRFEVELEDTATLIAEVEVVP